jgi:hypothetical protein
MTRFRFGCDPLCLGSCGLYALNRWLLKPHVHSPFLHSHFNDLLLIPAALPFVLWAQKSLKLRSGVDYPSKGEILFHLAIWAVVCEWAGPRFIHAGAGDIWDVLAYAVGAFGAAIWWSMARKRASVSVGELWNSAEKNPACPGS